MRLCQRGVLQFVIVKPIVSTMDAIMLAAGLYFNPIYQYFEAIIYNIRFYCFKHVILLLTIGFMNFSYGYALYCLFIFYTATKQLIENFRPILKFASVKG